MLNAFSRHRCLLGFFRTSKVPNSYDISDRGVMYQQQQFHDCTCSEDLACLYGVTAAHAMCC